MGLINYVEDIRQEVDIMCLINNISDDFLKILGNLLESIYGKKEEVWFRGNEVCISMGRRNRIQIDMLFESENHYIPIELKKRGNINALHQLEDYMDTWYFEQKESVGLIICKNSSKELKTTIKKYKNIYLLDLEEIEIY